MEAICTAWNLRTPKVPTWVGGNYRYLKLRKQRKRALEHAFLHYYREYHTVNGHLRLKFFSPKELPNYFATFNPKVKENLILLHG